MPVAHDVRPPLHRRLMLGFALLASTASVSAWPLSPALESLFGQQKTLHAPPILLDSESSQEQRRSLRGRFLHITDFHPDEFYRVHTSTEEGIACHRGKGLAGTFGAEKTDCDSPYSLVDATLKWIEDNVRDQVDFVIWTGDSARHDSDEEHPRHEADVVKSNRIVADKIFSTFSSDGQLTIPVVPTFGNNDFLPHNVMFAGPNKWFQTYTQIWRHFIPEEQQHTFAHNGWFSVEVIPDQLAVFSLNTMFFFDRNPAVDGCAHPDEPGYQQLDWLRVQLQAIRARGMKAILIGHVPPARTESKQLWDETCWQKYTLWLKQYRDIVTASLYGHMNIDHFLLQDAEDLQPELGAEQLATRDFLGDQLWATSKEDYLQELRDRWAELPNSVVHVTDDREEEEGPGDGDPETEKGGKKRKKKKKNKKGKYHDIGGKHAERFQLTFISPSVVPNYFPTIRIMEYNTTGLEDAPAWMDSHNPEGVNTPPRYFENAAFELEHVDAHRIEQLKKDKKGKGKPGRKPPGDHNLIIPEGPSKQTGPGPAYFPQPLTLTGYTQYFANLTYINDDIPDDVDGARWREGKHDDKEPKHGGPRPLEFEYQVEYSTFHDKIYKLPDLTLRSYLKLAYRMGQRVNQGKGQVGPADYSEDWFEEEEDSQGDETLVDIEEVEGVGAVQEAEEVEGIEEDKEAEEMTSRIELGQEGDVTASAGDDADASGKKKKKKKKKDKKEKKNKKKENNKTWLRFLQRAFVGTVPMNELRQM